MFFLLMGCAHSDKEMVNNVNTLSKAEIESYIDANWQDYGYSEKPVKYIALSFDDGPCAPSAYGGTVALLTMLETLKVKTTFFVIGSNVRNNKAAARAIFAAGHELGNHSDSYNSLGSSQINEITSSLNAASFAIKEITGSNPRLFRAPNLNHGANLSRVCKNLNMILIDGSAHNDWP
ncbi:MAG: polysaccharide deacetylase family protein, partial [Treponema sp.]|nr:polysaccharide deacetylase family protein [Treponema sp.]